MYPVESHFGGNAGNGRPGADRPIDHIPDAGAGRPEENRPGYGPNRPGPNPGRPAENLPGRPPNFPEWANNVPGGAHGVMSKPEFLPPSRIPVRAALATRAVDYGSMRGCLFHSTYVWLRNDVAFWFYPVYIGRRSVSGYRWTKRGWAYTGIDLSWIDYFECV